MWSPALSSSLEILFESNPIFFLLLRTKDRSDFAFNELAFFSDFFLEFIITKEIYFIFIFITKPCSFWSKQHNSYYFTIKSPFLNRVTRFGNNYCHVGNTSRVVRGYEKPRINRFSNFPCVYVYTTSANGPHVRSLTTLPSYRQGDNWYVISKSLKDV